MIDNLIEEWEGKLPDEKTEALEAISADLLNHIGDALRDNRRMRTELKKLQKFKDYVHRRLDQAGVPEDPMPSETDRTGCRVGQRLNWLLNESRGA